MSPGSRVVLLTIILASAVGAITMCLLVIRYGFPAADDGEPENASRRLVVTRIGHALAGACFAVVAVLATILAVRPPVTPPPVIAAPPSTSPEPPADTVGRVRAEMEELALRLEERITALEERTSAAASAGGETGDRVAAAPPAVALPPRPGSGPRPRGAGPPAEAATSRLARRTPPPSAVTPPAADAPSASPGLASHFTVTTQGLRVELTSVPSRPTPGDVVIYTAKLSDGAGRPLIAADVSVEGAAADGAGTHVRMEPATEAGVYRGRVAVTGSGPHGLRLRVSHRDARFEVPLPE